MARRLNYRLLIVLALTLALIAVSHADFRGFGG